MKMNHAFLRPENAVNCAFLPKKLHAEARFADLPLAGAQFS
jgi:hypothetical protein